MLESHQVFKIATIAELHKDVISRVSLDGFSKFDDELAVY